MCLESYSESSVRIEDIDEKDCVVPEDIPEVIIQEPNRPQIVVGMTPIKWTGTSEVNTTEDDEDWYDYKNKKWANVKTADGSYWVWIPRYAYKIKSGFHSSYGWSSSEVDPHMMTNLEWGGVTYLTHSVYGKNEEVWINPNSDYKTGCAGDSVSASETSICNEYTTANGQQASTTGNITGIHDMSGGAWEYIATYLDNSHENLTLYLLNLLNETNLKYKNVYQVIGTDSDINNYNNSSNIYGDGVYEISNSYAGTTSWYGDYSVMPTAANVAFLRGGRYNNTTGAGLFSFTRGTGTSSIDHSFRVSLRVN